MTTTASALSVPKLMDVALVPSTLREDDDDEQSKLNSSTNRAPDSSGQRQGTTESNKEEAPVLLDVQPEIISLTENDDDEFTNPSSSVNSSNKSENSTTMTTWRERIMQHSLYDRVDEEAKLVESFEKSMRVAPHQNSSGCGGHHDHHHHQTDFMLISGPSGSGKKHLVSQSLKDRVQAQGGYFLFGKFDQFCRPAAYTAFVAAFTEFANLVLQRDEETICKMQHAIRQEFGDTSSTEDVSVLTNMIPALEGLLLAGKESKQGSSTSPGDASKLKEANQRFIFAFRMFIRAVCSPERPVVLLLDNLQYADHCSLDLLCLLLKDRDTQSGFVIVGTRDDTVSPNPYLATKLQDIEESGPDGITNITLSDLARNRVQHVLADAFQLNDEQSQSLAHHVYRQTHGNFAYMINFLQWLQDSNQIVLDDATEKWSWSESDLRNSTPIRDVRDFLSQHVMERLPSSVQEMLKVAAYLGGSLDERLLEYILDLETVKPILDQAAALGVLVYGESHKRYDFKDDSVQAAAYHLIPQDEREKFHLMVGRKLWRKLDLDELDRYIFVVLAQLKAGRNEITKEKEKVAICKLSLHGGKKAAKAATFRTASMYLEFGISLLEKRSWRDEYELTLSIYNHAAEMSMCVGDFERMDKLLQDIFLNARTFDDKVQAYGTQIYSLGSRGLPHESLDLGIQVLESLGERFPQRFCRVHLMSQFTATQKLLRSKSDEQLLRLPLIQNQQKLRALQILQLLVLNALLVRPQFAPFVVLMCMRLTLKYGLSAIASGSFGTYGMLCLSFMGDAGCSEANRYANLALILLDRFETVEYLPRVYAAVYGCILPWTKPLRLSLEPLLRAHRVGLRSGDLEFSALCAAQFCGLAFESGASLDFIDHEWKCFQDAITSDRQESMLDMMRPHIQAIHHYMGLTTDPLSPKGDILDFEEEKRRSIETGAADVACCIRCCQMTLAYIFNAYELAAENCATVLKEVAHIPPSYDRVNVMFYAALVSLAMARKGKNIRKNIRLSKRIMKQFKTWATLAPQNILDKRFLIEAELASVRGNNPRAFEKYICAISLSRDTASFTHALCNERAARHLLTAMEDDATAAKPYFEQACVSYETWGGRAKVERLRNEMNTLYASKTA